MTPRTRLGEDIQATLQRDPAARNAVEVFFTSPGVKALFWHRVANKLWRAGVLDDVTQDVGQLEGSS